MPVPAGWDQSKAYERAVRLLEGAAPYKGRGGEVEFSRGTWRRRRSPGEAISSKSPAAAELASRGPRAALLQPPSEPEDADHAAVLRRTWTDIDFDGGEDANQSLVQVLETEFAEQLAGSMQDPALREALRSEGEAGAGPPLAPGEAWSGSGSAGLQPSMPAGDSVLALSSEEVSDVLNQSENLGASLDMIGVYLKNYMTDKADMVLRRVMPLCRQRGGFWLIKALNIAACVCSKQDRHEEALAALEELQQLVRARLAELGSDEAVAWAFYDMVYKNVGWTLEALGRHSEAFSYFERAVEVKRANGVAPTWFDQWDLGKALAHMAYEQRQEGELRRATGLIEGALELQRRSEPSDRVTAGKLLRSCGGCQAALGELAGALQDQRAAWAEAERLLREGRALFLEACGPSSPLTGAASEDLASVLVRLRRWHEAREMLQQALHCECIKDIIELPRVNDAVEGLLAVHRALGEGSRPLDGERLYGSDVVLGLSNLRRRGVDAAEPLCYAALLLRASKLLGARGGLVQEAAACLQFAWEEGPDPEPDPTLSLHVFQKPLEPQLLPPRAQRQGFKVSLQSLLLEFQAEIQELEERASAEPEKGVDSKSIHVGGYQVLD